MYRITIICLIIFTSSTLFSSEQPDYFLEKNMEISILSGSMFFFLSGILLDVEKKGNTEKEISMLSRNDINRFDRSATGNWSPKSDNMSDIIYGVGLATPVLFTCLIPKMRENFLTINFIYLETFLVCQSLIYFSKSAVDRRRPYVYNQNVSVENKTSKEANRSFFSGHTVTTFAAMVFTAKMYSNYYNDSCSKYFVWIAALSIASTVGYLRYNAGQHYLSDIVFGAIVGGTVGYVIPEMHNRNSSLSCTPSKKGMNVLLCHSILF